MNHYPGLRDSPSDGNAAVGAAQVNRAESSRLQLLNQIAQPGNPSVEPGGGGTELFHPMSIAAAGGADI